MTLRGISRHSAALASRIVIRAAASVGQDGAQLVVEESTIRTHVKRILMTLAVRDRVQAVIVAYEATGRSSAAAQTGPSW